MPTVRINSLFFQLFFTSPSEPSKIVGEKKEQSDFQSYDNIHFLFILL